MRIQLVADASAALLALLVNTTLSIYKPRGMTPYGRRKQHEQRTGDDTLVRSHSGSAGRTPTWVKVFGVIVIVLVLVFVILHLSGGGLGGHGPG